MINIEQLKETFRSYVFKKKDNEDNFFALGLRNFYENPFTEVLGYILDSKSQYTYKGDFIHYFLSDILPRNVLDSLINFSQTSIQCRTNRGNYMDLIVFNSECVIVFENKIFHNANNPFDDYKAYIEQAYSMENKYYILLSYKNQTAPDGWGFVSIPNQFDKIIKNIPTECFNKWDYFVLDFLKHFSIKNLNMSDEEKEFYEKNFHKIIAANNNLDAYINDIIKRFANDNQVRWNLLSKWSGQTKAIRLYPVEDNNSNVVLIFETDGSFKIFIYYYKNYFNFLNEIYNIVGIEKYIEWSEGRTAPICCFALKQGHEYDSLNRALEECKKQISSMKTYFK